MNKLLLIPLFAFLVSCQKEHCTTCYKNCKTVRYYQNQIGGGHFNVSTVSDIDYEPQSYCGTEKEIAKKEDDNSSYQSTTSYNGDDYITLETTCSCDCK